MVKIKSKNTEIMMNLKNKITLKNIVTTILLAAIALPFLNVVPNSNGIYLSYTFSMILMTWLVGFHSKLTPYSYLQETMLIRDTQTKPQAEIVMPTKAVVIQKQPQRLRPHTHANLSKQHISPINTYEALSN